LKTEKAKNTELQRLYDDQRSQNKTYMKELNEREQILEKIEFLNQVLQEKEQELMLARGEIPKQEKFYEDNFKNMKMKHENQIKSLENDLDSYSQQIERLTYEIQVVF
jgi:predicted  nucleic acid-binding Zn-ribbon protein